MFRLAGPIGDCKGFWGDPIQGYTTNLVQGSCIYARGTCISYVGIFTCCTDVVYSRNPISYMNLVSIKCSLVFSIFSCHDSFSLYGPP